MKLLESRLPSSNTDPATYRGVLEEAGLEIKESEYEGRPGDDEYHW